MRPRAEWALAAIPLGVTFLLIRHSASDDQYFETGQSYWDTHSSGRAVVVIAALINITAAIAVLWNRLILGTLLIGVGFVASVVAWIAITAN